MEIRQVRDEEFFRWRIAVRGSLGTHTSLEDTKFMRAHRVELDRLLVCMDGDTMAGSGGADSFDMTLPGGVQVPAAGVAYITTAATHRRRGIQRAIMRRIHDDARARGDIAAILWASQSLLYHRYGYGNTIPVHNWHIDLRHTEFAHAPDWAGHYVKAEREEAIPLMTEAYERTRVSRAGMITRTEKRWQYEVHPVHTQDEFFIIYKEGDVALAYARYTIEQDPDDEFSGTMHVVEAVAATDAAHAALWRFLLDQELVGELTAHVRPVDDPLVWMLSEPRRLRRRLTDAIWMKFLDVPAMLENRAYPVEDSLVIQVLDAETGERRTLELECGAEGGRCRDIGTSPDLVMSEAELAAIYMGAAECSILANMGLIDVAARAPDAALRADAMFRTSPAGWNPYHF
jgi:predicted acetyltransferase